ncbi:hypothetical protein J3R82DRAFT_3770 [Butyriboletus roseoflavus]|nr:hypothetical protein J3R82DRAFT_3770 [Butyriboletus roseoflavus]
MSPVPSVATALVLSPTARSVGLDPDSAGQSAWVVSQHLGTGGLLFAVVAIFSVAGYFYHGRGEASSARTSSTWASLSSFLSSMRHRGSAPTSTATTATDWPVDLEVGPEHHVSMVYAKFFHPIFWNLVECHPATPSTPAIYVEDETNEIPVSDPIAPGVSSFLDMDDDGGGADANGDSPQRTSQEPERGARPRVEEFPPYDTSSPIEVSFTSKVIGTTARPGAFLSVPGELEDDSSESLSSDSGLDLSCSAYDGISMSPPRLSSSTRRHGMADMGHLVQGLKDTIPEEGYDLVPTISCRNGLLDVSVLLETDPAMSCGPLERVEPVDDDEPTATNCDIGVHDNRGDLQSSWSDADTLVAPHEGVDLMRRLLAELRDPSLDCSPRALSEDSDIEHSDDDDDEAAVPPLTPTRRLHGVRRNSPESTSSTPTTGDDVSEEGPIYPLTPPPRSALASIADIHKARMAPPVTPWFKKEVQAMSPVFSESPPSLPTKAYVRTHRDTRLLLYGPRLPLVALPRL